MTIKAKTIHVPVQAGVYCIQNMLTGECYVGASVNMQKRCRGRFSEMRSRFLRGMLNEAYKTYGLDAFRCYALLVCAPEHLRFYESRAIEVLNPAYNQLPSVASSRWPNQRSLAQTCPTCGQETDTRPGPKSKKKP